MAFKLISTNGQVQYNVDEYVIDTPNDLKKLPAKSAQGSVALCTSTGDLYMKNGSGEWVAIWERSRWLIDLVTYALVKKYVKASLAGAGALKGEDGKSAYEIAVQNGYSGSE